MGIWCSTVRPGTFARAMFLGSVALFLLVAGRATAQGVNDDPQKKVADLEKIIADQKRLLDATRQEAEAARRDAELQRQRAEAYLYLQRIALAEHEFRADNAAGVHRLRRISP